MWLRWGNISIDWSNTDNTGILYVINIWVIKGKYVVVSCYQGILTWTNVPQIPASTLKILFSLPWWGT